MAESKQAETGSSNATVMPAECAAISIRGARTNNLKSVDVDIAHDSFTVITGPSGCGKSSLAIDTIFAEGQRQYIETLSIYARQFIHQLPRAEVNSIDGLMPAMRIDQYAGAAGKRSTVGTITGLHDYFRLLFAKAGSVHCHQCGKAVRQQPAESIVKWICELPEGTRVMLLAPMIRNRKGKHDSILEKIRKERLVRCRIDGIIYDIEALPALNPKSTHSIEAVADRIVVRTGSESRIAESVHLCLAISDGTVAVAWQQKDAGDSWQEKLFSTRHACPDCGINYPPIEPQLFSFNSPQGACPTCEGLGVIEQFVAERVFSDRRKSISDGAMNCWEFLSTHRRKKLLAELEPLFKLARFAPSDPLDSLSETQWSLFWKGDTRTPGMSLRLEQMLATATDSRLLPALESARDDANCTSCNGSRLKTEALGVKLLDRNIAEAAAMPIAECSEYVERLFGEFGKDAVADPVVKQLRSRTGFLVSVGLNYLTMDRNTRTLSGGEYQRVRLAAAIGNDLTNCCFVLDEPSIGLHPRDNDRLIQTLLRLRDAGNTLIVVEHDESIMRAADHLIDIGPAAGRNGGKVVFSGDPESLMRDRQSLTGAYLRGEQRIEVPAQRRRPPPEHCDWIRIGGAKGHNLQSIDVRIPCGLLVAITGVSGSGKSTLINGTLVPALSAHLGLMSRESEPFKSLTVPDFIRRVVPVDQKPIGRSTRGCPATFSGVMDDLRKLFAGTREAKRLGLGPSAFSFNSSAGWCPACQGHGDRRISMNFMPDIHVRCESCNGSRYSPQTLQCRFRGVTIGDVLRMEISDVCREFAAVPRIHRVLKTMVDAGIGYLQLGQSTATLSGGECQRLRLAAELTTRSVERGVYVLDEPTTGLHFVDTERLLAMLQRLVDQGHSVIVIEHHTDIIKAADWVIDLGPEGGTGGGTIVAEGTPEDVAGVPNSLTGYYIQRALKGTK